MNKSNNLTTVIIAGFFALAIAVVAAVAYVKGQQSNQPIQTSTEQPSAVEIAELVRESMRAAEQEKAQSVLAGLLEPWSDAREGQDRIYGNPDARFSIVTFSDLECPFCKRFNDTPKQVVDASGGSVNYEFKHMPLDFHNPVAKDGALMVECVAKHKGNQHAFAFIDQYFQKSGTNGAGVADLDALVQSFGVTNQQIAECKRDQGLAKRVQDDKVFGAEAGVTGTPNSFVVDTVGGQSIQIGGAQGPEVFMNAVRNLLESAEQKKSTNDEEASNDAPKTN